MEPHSNCAVKNISSDKNVVALIRAEWYSFDIGDYNSLLSHAEPTIIARYQPDTSGCWKPLGWKKFHLQPNPDAGQKPTARPPSFCQTEPY